MNFYMITLKSIPEFLFCCSVKLEKLTNTFRNLQNFLEICVIEEGGVIREYQDGEKQFLQPNTLAVFTSETNCRVYSHKNEIQRHTTVGICANYDIVSLKQGECLEKINKAIDTNTIFLPDYCLLAKNSVKNFSFKLKKIASLRNSIGHSNNIKALSAWYDLCAETTSLTYNILNNNKFKPSEDLYTNKIFEYIYEHVNSKISIPEISNQLGISEGYMQNIFKKTTGKTIIEYSNEYKINTATEILKIHKMSQKELSASLGIDDPLYFSRLFKKIMGINFTEYVATLKKIR